MSGCPVNVSCISLSPHTGAHADAPLHYASDASAIGDVNLQAYLSPCRAPHCLDCRPLVQPARIAHALHSAAGLRAAAHGPLCQPGLDII